MSRSVLLLIGSVMVVASDGGTGLAAEASGPLSAPPAVEDRSPSPEEPVGEAAIDAERTVSTPFAWSTLLRELADESIPREYEVRQGWGGQAEIVTGVRVREKNGLPRVSRRTKQVNHGVWRRFQVQLHRPEEKLRFAIQDVRSAERGGLTFKVVASARLRCTGQSEFWSYGVRTGSVTVQADATVRIVARFVVSGRETDPDDDGWLVQVEYAPAVDRVRIDLQDFDVRRVGHLDGDLADGFGNTAEHLLGEILQSQEKKVTRRIQRELGERDARVSLTLPRLLWEGE